MNSNEMIMVMMVVVIMWNNEIWNEIATITNNNE